MGCHTAFLPSSRDGAGGLLFLYEHKFTTSLGYSACVHTHTHTHTNTERERERERERAPSATECQTLYTPKDSVEMKEAERDRQREKGRRHMCIMNQCYYHSNNQSAFITVTEEIYKCVSASISITYT